MYKLLHKGALISYFKKSCSHKLFRRWAEFSLPPSPAASFFGPMAPSQKFCTVNWCYCPSSFENPPYFLGYFGNLIPHLRPKSHPHLIISSTTFIQSLSEVICACVIRVGELDRCQFFLGGQMIGIDLLSSCIDFNDKAATVSESSCSTAWAPKPCFWRSYQRSMLELLLPPLCKDVMLPHSVIRPLISPFLGESAVFLNISSQCHPIFLCYFPLLLLYIYT